MNGRVTFVVSVVLACAVIDAAAAVECGVIRGPAWQGKQRTAGVKSLAK